MSGSVVEVVRFAATGRLAIFAFGSIADIEVRALPMFAFPASSFSLINCSNSISVGSGRSSDGMSFGFSTDAVVAAGATGIVVIGECRLGVGIGVAPAAFAEWKE